MKTALIACGALAREVLALRKKYGWDADVLAVDALLHNRPEQIPAAVAARLREARKSYPRVIVVYGDCGTGGGLDRLLASEGVERVRGAHCYQMFAAREFERLMTEEPGTFFLTDYLLESFDQLIVEGLGLDRFPELRDEYFRNYRRVVYLAQTSNPSRDERARRAADTLGLPLEIVRTGYGMLEDNLQELMGHESEIPDPFLAGHSGAGEGAGGQPPSGAQAFRALPGGD